MPLRRLLPTAAMFVAACTTSPTPAPSAAALPRTRAERTNYLETSSYADMIAFVDSLKALRAPIAVSELAKSPLGKSVPIIVASRPVVRTPAEARALNRPIVYVQANIHAGEVEGKEAVLAMLRDWSFSTRPTVLDSLVVIIVPMYNTDGNDKLAAQARNRGAQHGPEMIGERPNGAGLDLNRDYVKAEAPETMGSLAAFNAWEPDLFMDLHTTNGSYHGYALTYSPSLHPAAPLASFTADTLLPEIRRRMKSKHNTETFPYGNFTGANGRESLTADVKSGWVTYEHKQRYGTNYAGLRGGISILSEAYSHDPFDKRVASTRDFVQEILSYVAQNRREVMTRVRAGIAAATYAAGSGTAFPVRARFNSHPDTQVVLVERLDRIADSTRLTQPGVPRGLQRTGVMTAQRMPVVDRFESSLSRTLAPYGYAISGEWPTARELLTAHGISFRVLPAPATVTGQEFVIDTVNVSGRPFQGHREVSVDGRWRDVSRQLPAGTLVVQSGTRRDLLALLLLEPESDDGFLTWNVFDASLGTGKVAPVVRLTAPLR
ncbi:M14 family metallopeptidase [Gemmatimonas sp.]|uniref:M14 family metallopeptidase n=1 Tax=Gemmatimonas sp. TaxID=1962908 RepID=UPI0037BF133A